MRSLWLVLAILSIPALCLTHAVSRPAFRQARPAETRIHWTHDNGHSDRRYLPETIGPGVAIFDYDNDGWMDIFFVNSGEAPFFHPNTRLHPALYRNNHDGTFTEVTAKAGLDIDLFGMGAAAGDYDGDGWTDLLLTGYGRCVLFHNNKNGTFRDVTDESGINVSGWFTTAVWFDYDADGRPDLFLARFVDYSSLKSCGGTNAYGGNAEGVSAAQTFYCIPRIFDPMSPVLYRNQGDGRFSDVTEASGVGKLRGKGFGVVATDINNDGWLDLFQANDTVPNFLFVNRGGKFEEIGLASGVAYSEDGLARSGMGVDAADFDQDGKQDLFVANIDQETFSIYRNQGEESFADVGRTGGIAGPTRLLSGWGLKFFDYDNDGFPDLLLANGHPDDLVDSRMKGVTYEEPLLLFHNDGRGKMTNVSGDAGEAFSKNYSARGLAVGDLNNDGFADVVVGINGGAPIVLYNTASTANHWLGLHLRSTHADPAGTGALIRWSAGGVVHSRLKTAGGSFLSSHDPREVLGLGTAAKADWIEIHWPKPSTCVDRFTNLAADRYLNVVEGGKVVE